MTKPLMTKKTSTPMYPPSNPGTLRVREDHQDDGDRAQALDVRSERLVRAPVARYGARRPGIQVGLVEYGHADDATSTIVAFRALTLRCTSPTRRLGQSLQTSPAKKSKSPVRSDRGDAVTGLAFYVALPAFVKVLSAWPKLFHLSFAWLALMLVAEVASFLCAMTLLRLLLRTKHWFTVVAALLVGNAVTNVLPAGDVAGAGVQYQMLAIGGINADSAAGGLAAASTTIGLAGTFCAGVCVARHSRGPCGEPGLSTAAYLGIAGFVLIVAFGAVLLTTNGLLTWLAKVTQRTLNAIPKRKTTTRDLPERLIEERNLVRANLGRRWREAVLLIGGRIGFDYFALLCALRATGAQPNAPLVLLAYAATAVIALVPLTPGGLGIVEASLSGLLVLAGVPSASAIIRDPGLSTRHVLAADLRRRGRLRRLSAPLRARQVRRRCPVHHVGELLLVVEKVDHVVRMLFFDGRGLFEHAPRRGVPVAEPRDDLGVGADRNSLCDEVLLDHLGRTSAAVLYSECARALKVSGLKSGSPPSWPMRAAMSSA